MKYSYSHMDKIKELKQKISEMESLLKFIGKYNLPISNQAHVILSDEIQEWKIELARLENQQYKSNRRLIVSN